jgi:hypothetical protein
MVQRRQIRTPRLRHHQYFALDTTIMGIKTSFRSRGYQFPNISKHGEFKDVRAKWRRSISIITTISRRDIEHVTGIVPARETYARK